MLEIWKTNGGGGQSSSQPRLVVLPNDNYVVFYSNGAPGLAYNVYDTFGEVVQNGHVSVFGGWPARIMDVKLREDGGFDVLFGYDESNTVPDLFLARLNTNFELVDAPKFIVADFGGFAEMQHLPDGEIAVVYPFINTSGVRNVGLKFVGIDGTVSSNFKVNSGTTDSPLFVQLAANDQRMFAVWLDTNGSQVYGQFLDFNGVKIGGEFAISSGSNGIENRFAVENLPDGKFLVVWTTDTENGADTDAQSVHGRIFSATGTPLGSEFLVNDVTAGNQSVSGLGVAADGSFFVSWSNVTNGSSSGYAIRWFNADGTPKTASLNIGEADWQHAIAPLSDGRIVLSAGAMVIVDTRMGVIEGDEGDNLLFSSNASASTANGYGGNDRFYGGEQIDTFKGGAGNDIFNYSWGADVFVGGPGDDLYYLYPETAVPFRTTIVELADEGIDTVHTSSDYTLPDNVENAVVYEFNGTAGEVRGNSLANNLTGNSRTNSLYGFDGDDHLSGLGGRDLLDGGAGADTLLGGEGDDVLVGGSGADVIDGGNGDDEIKINSVSDWVSGEMIDGGAGQDRLVLASSITTFDFSQMTLTSVEGIWTNSSVIALTMRSAQLDALQELAVFNAFTITLTDAGAITLAGLFAPGGSPRIYLSEFGNSLDARGYSANPVAVFGGASADQIWLGDKFGEAHGGGGDDQLFGQAGRDHLFGDDGNDVIEGGEQADYLDGGSGDDVIQDIGAEDAVEGGSGADALYRTGGGNATLGGGTGTDTLFISGLSTSFTIVQDETGSYLLTNISGTGTDYLTGIEQIQFSDQLVVLPSYGTGVTLTGTADADTLTGSAFADILRGLDGNDTLVGDAGDDMLNGGLGNDRLTGGPGTDTLDYSDATAAIKITLAKLNVAQNTGGAGSDTLVDLFENLTGSAFKDTLTGNALANVISGGNGNDKIDGGAGADHMIGGNGNDSYIVDDTNDIVDEAGTDGSDAVSAKISFVLGTNVEKLTLTGTAVIDGTGNELANTIIGNSAANVLSGLQSKDTIKGGAGDDLLIGGAGADILTGEAGADRFRFDTLETTKEKDTIKDFEHGIDKLEISTSAFAAFAGDLDGLLDLAEFSLGTKATTADQHLIYDQIKGALYYDADGVGGAAQIQIALLSTRPLLDEGDFLLV